MTESSKERALELIKIAQDLKAEDIIMFDVDGKSTLTDYIIVCQGRSQGHVKGIADRIEQEMKKGKVLPLGIEGYSEGSWILMDYGEAVIHIFHPDTRSYFDLEKLHDNCPKEHY